ncbi:MAG: calcium-binding protein, partial [Planctomycetota bacterium]
MPNQTCRLLQAAAIETLESRRLLAADPLYIEPFDEPAAATVGVLNGPEADGERWRTFQPNGGVAVDGGVLRVANTGGITSWFTDRLDISGQGPVDISVDLTAANLGPNDVARFLVRVDDGPQQQFAFVRGASGNGSLTATAEGITGANVRVEIQFQAVQGEFTLDNFAVTTDSGTGGEQVSFVVEDRVLKVTGTEGADDIQVLGGNDVSVYQVFDAGELLAEVDVDDFDSIELLGLGGDDTLEVKAGFEDDFVSFGPTARTVFVDGGAGNDTIDADGLEGQARGGDGDDSILGRNAVIAFGDAGDDTFNPGTRFVFRFTAFGGEGNDTLTASNGESSYSFFGEGGDDVANVFGSAFLRGGDGNDTLSVSVFSEFASSPLGEVVGGAGDDTITLSFSSSFKSGRGTIDAGDGDDVVDVTEFVGGTLDIDLGAGNDTLISGRGADEFDGGDGIDTVDYTARAGDDDEFIVNQNGLADDGDPVLFVNPDTQEDVAELDNINNVENVLGATEIGLPTTTLFSEPFDEADGATTGTIAGPDGSGVLWRTFRGGVGGGTFVVDDGVLVVDDTDSFVSWFTNPLDISGAGPVDISLDLTAANLGPDDLARFVFRVDDGPQQQFAFVRGASGNGSLTATAEGITGDTLRVEVQFQALEGSFTLDNFAVTAAGTSNQQVQAVQNGNTLDITGTDEADVIVITRELDEELGSVLRVIANEADLGVFPGISRINADLRGGDDNFDLDTGLPNTFITTVFGGAGNDVIRVDEGDHALDGGAGDDDIAIAFGGGVIRGGDGNDTLDGGNEDGVAIFGGDGNDVISAALGNLFGEAGDDELTVVRAAFSGGGGLLDGGSGDDLIRITGAGTNAEAIGGAGDDIILADPETNVSISGGSGNDMIDAFDSVGDIDGGIGNDTIVPTRSGDVRGGDGNDTFRPRAGANGNGVARIFGDTGNDTLFSSTDNEDFSGGAGTDTVDYRGRANGPFTVTFDDVANDGAAGEGDNIRSDVEIALGVDDGGDSVLVSESFDEANGATTGTLTGPGGGSWRTFRGGPIFSVQDGVFRATDTGGFSSWFTRVIQLDSEVTYD